MVVIMGLSYGRVLFYQYFFAYILRRSVKFVKDIK